MIKLISCNSRDMSMYYQGCILYDVESERHVFVEEIRSDYARVFDREHRGYIVNPSNLRVAIPEVQYTSSGNLITSNAQRSYKRGFVPDAVLVMETLTTLDGVDDSENRIGKSFFIKTKGSIRYLEYRGELCGLVQDSTIYLKDQHLASRLQECLPEGYDVVVS